MEVAAAGALSRFSNKGAVMNLPKIDISALPDLDTLTGVFGSLAKTGNQVIIDDSFIDLMVYIYELINQSGGG